MELPDIPESLIVHLEFLFKDRMPEPTDSLETIRFKQGQVSVVRAIRAAFEDQNKRGFF